MFVLHDLIKWSHWFGRAWKWVWQPFPPPNQVTIYDEIEVHSYVTSHVILLF